MRGHVAIRWTIGLVLSAALASGCGIVSGTPAPSSCDGISSGLGGCAAGQPSFAGTTCAEVGAEWGQAVDAGIRAVIAGPPTADGKQRSARISDVMVLAFVRASQQLQTAGRLEGCSSADFLSAATPAFSADLKRGIGSALYDGSPEATFEQFLAEVQNVIRGLDAS
jgi:hypothetical protein